MTNVEIATTATEILPLGTRNEQLILIQNQSDTTLRLAFGDANIAALSSTVGFQLEPGESVLLEGAQSSRRICALHGASGTKTAHWQRL